MPTSTKDVVATGGRFLDTVTFPVERSVLMCASIISLNASQQVNDAYAQVGLMSGGINMENIVAVLATGYVGYGIPISWTGYLITEADLYLYGRIRSTASSTFRLAAMVVPYKISSEGGILLDP